MLLSVIGYVLILLTSLGLGVWIFTTLIGTAVITAYFETSAPVGRLLSNQLFNSTMSPELLALPLFVLMAEILFRTKLSQSLFSGLAPWTRKIPGQLIHVNVLAATLFASVCGSSAATTATVGKITLTELLKRGYPPALATGSLAGAGTLGFLIPPSLIMIVYGVLSDTSIIRLFLAGVIPGIVLAIIFMSIICILSFKYRMPAKTSKLEKGWQLRSLMQIGPLVALMATIIGSMYLGLATPTEAAVVGVLGSIAIGVSQRSLSLSVFIEALLAAGRTSSMIGMLIAGGAFLSIVMGYVGVPQAVTSWIGTLGLNQYELIGMLFIVLVILGCFLDGTSILIMTLPITLPMIAAVGIDKIWFGIFMVVVIELAQITPPVGFNLFMIQSISGHPLGKLAIYAFPFFLGTVFFALLITVFPDIVLFLPRMM